MLKKAFLFVVGEDLNDFIKYFLTSTDFGKDKFLLAAQNQKTQAFLTGLQDLMSNSPAKLLPSLRSLITSSYSLK